MTYDGLDQLVRVDLPDELRVEYAYGYDGQRIVTRDNRGSVEYWFAPDLRQLDGVREHYVKVGERIVAKVTMAPD